MYHAVYLNGGPRAAALGLLGLVPGRLYIYFAVSRVDHLGLARQPLLLIINGRASERASQAERRENAEEPVGRRDEGVKRWKGAGLFRSDAAAAACGGGLWLLFPLLPAGLAPAHAKQTNGAN